MESNYSLADLQAILNHDNDNGFSFGGVGGLILILLFFLIFGGSFGGFGIGNRNVNDTVGLSTIDRDVLMGNCETQKEIQAVTYNNLLNFKDVQHQIADCCCNLKSMIHSEGEATRALIQDNTIGALRERLNATEASLSAQSIVNQITNNLQPTPKPAYLAPSPYASYGYGYPYYFGGCNNGNVF